jgi:hypothetical protein
VIEEERYGQDKEGGIVGTHHDLLASKDLTNHKASVSNTCKDPKSMLEKNRTLPFVMEMGVRPKEGKEKE